MSDSRNEEYISKLCAPSTFRHTKNTGVKNQYHMLHLSVFNQASRSASPLKTSRGWVTVCESNGESTLPQRTVFLPQFNVLYGRREIKKAQPSSDRRFQSRPLHNSGATGGMSLASGAAGVSAGGVSVPAVKVTAAVRRCAFVIDTLGRASAGARAIDTRTSGLRNEGIVEPPQQRPRCVEAELRQEFNVYSNREAAGRELRQEFHVAVAGTTFHS